MRQKIEASKPSAEKVIKDTRRVTRKQYGAEEKIRIVLDGLRGIDFEPFVCVSIFNEIAAKLSGSEDRICSSFMSLKNNAPSPYPA